MDAFKTKLIQEVLNQVPANQIAQIETMSHDMILYLINGLLIIVLVIGWQWIKDMKKSQKENQIDISNLKTSLALNTQQDSAHDKEFKEIKEWMKRIEDKLDQLKN